MAFYLRKYSIHFIPLGKEKLLVFIQRICNSKEKSFLLLPWSYILGRDLEFQIWDACVSKQATHLIKHWPVLW